MTVWCGLLFATATAVALIIGSVLRLTGLTFEYVLHCMLILSAATLMNVCLNMLTSFLACWTRGYLAAIGFVIVTLILGNFVGMLGFANYYPWGIPMLYATKGLEGAYLGTASIIVVTATSLIGLIATLFWWRYADQT
jgi:ABC-2 type transport system permease protein